MQIFVHRNNQQLGPFTEAELRAQLAAGTIKLQDHAWWEGQAGWVPLAQTPFASALLLGPVNIPPGLPPGPAAPHLTIPLGPRPSNLATASLVCGIASLFCCCPSLLMCGGIGIFVPSIAAVILGHLALSDIKRNQAVKGREQAIAGLIMGYLFLILGLIYLVTSIIFMITGNKMMYIEQFQKEFRPVPGITSPSNGSDDDDNSSTNSTSTNSPSDVTP